MTDWEGRDLTLEAFLQGKSKGRVVAASSQALWKEAVAELQGEGQFWSSVEPEVAVRFKYFLLGAAAGVTFSAAFATVFARRQAE